MLQIVSICESFVLDFDKDNGENLLFMVILDLEILLCVTVLQNHF